MTAKRTYKVVFNDLRGTETYNVADMDEFRRKFIAKHYNNYLNKKGPMFIQGMRGVGVPVLRVTDKRSSFVGTIVFWKSYGISWSPAKNGDVNLPVDPMTGKIRKSRRF